MKSLVLPLLRSWLTAAFFAIAACAADATPATDAAVRDYHAIFQTCHRKDSSPRLAIRRMQVGGGFMLLTVDPATLATSLEREQDWSCADTDDAAEQDTRFMRAVRMSTEPPALGPAGTGVALQPAFIANGGLTRGGLIRGAAAGSFVTGDLCPSRKPLNRDFLERLQAAEPGLPVALAISGAWLRGHRADFDWLRERARAGAWAITWVNHSDHHPYVPGRPLADNFLLMPGVDMRAELLDTEQLLIANGETPSVFFRFPGLISDTALMRVVRFYHLIVLGADAWLARSPRARPGAIILVHPNGNEPAGLEIFSTLLAGGKLPRPFRPIEEAP